MYPCRHVWPPSVLVAQPVLLPPPSLNRPTVEHGHNGVAPGGRARLDFGSVLDTGVGVEVGADLGQERWCG